MFQFDNMYGHRVNKTDFMFYAVSALVGLSIVSTNYYMSSMETSGGSPLESYMEKILTRMDMVSGQLSAWGQIDVRHDIVR